ncbi:MAG TPA: XrtA/PEP-CTERM system histidine kinase PrsK [Thiobacillaceae bacterium]|nr:XrtA/PEP-CTERM system histidine kinase PrsK [Thiobacillaceae bacterium]
MSPLTSPIVVVGHGLAALAYALLALLALSVWRDRPQAKYLAAASTASLLWALFVGLQPGISPLGLSLEVLRDFSWLGLLLAILFARGTSGARIPSHLKVLFWLAVGVTAILLPSLMLPSYWSALPRLTANTIDTSMVGLAVLGLVLVEQVYRGSPREIRWSLKFLALGLGGLFAYDFYLYANALLFQQLDADVWGARGLVCLVIAPLIAISFARQSSEPVTAMALSRRVMFHGAALLGAGIYLLLMAGAGYYIRIFGGDWGGVVQTAFLFAAAILLAVIFFSGTLRARLRVWMTKHFFRYHYDYREEWLKFTRMLSEGAAGERLGERTVEALARLVDSPGGALWLLDENTGYSRTAHWNMSDALGAEPPSSPFTEWLKTRQWVINVDEFRINSARYGDLELPTWVASLPDVWLLIPLMHHEHLIGFIALKHSLARIRFNWEVSDLIKTAARQAATHLAQMKATNALIVARQFESYNRATTFVIHDLKNLVAQLSLLLANAQKHKHKPEFQDDMIATVESSVMRMNKVLAQLRRGGQAGQQESVDLRHLLPEVISSKSAFRLRPMLDCSGDDLSVCADSAQLGRVIGHILQNALEATPDSGKVLIQANKVENQVALVISDTGCGMDAEFIRDRLFRPFDSTKGAGMGIGAYECREYVRELGGKITVESEPGQGTTFCIWLPVAQCPSAAQSPAAELKEQAA